MCFGSCSGEIASPEKYLLIHLGLNDISKGHRRQVHQLFGAGYFALQPLHSMR